LKAGASDQREVRVVVGSGFLFFSGAVEVIARGGKAAPALLGL
jgi:hypothetical protein